jgi:amidase
MAKSSKVKETIAAYDKVQAFAEHFVQNLLLITKAEAEEEDKDFPSITDTFHALFKPAIESYLQGLESSPARTLKELVERNREIPGELPPGYTQQDILEKDLDFKLQGWDPEGAANHVRARALKRGDDILAEHRIDIIIGPGDSSLTSFACAAGYPMASLPIGVLAFNERPFGVTAITRAHGEALLVRLMSAWEKVFLRQLPESLKIAEDDWLKTQETFKETSASFEKVKRV